MRRNIAGLKLSARRRRESATQRALAALDRMEASSKEINFRSVSTEARASTAWLYGEPELRSRIMLLRGPQSQAAPAPSGSQRREHLSRQNIVATLRLRIKSLEDKNRELTELLERAYGVIAKVWSYTCNI